VKKWLKSRLGIMVFQSGLSEPLTRDKAIVTCFHRVDDRLAGDSLSCTVDEFRSYLRFFKDHFHVISLPELLDRIERKHDISHCLVITFDDGYLDNYENAARELRALELPACFFIATGFIGTDRIAWWDQELPFQPRWMTWDDVRALASMGFDIGAHTINHVDLGAVNRTTAEAEIRGSRERLEQELGMKADLFAYPYGRKRQISEENRQLVRDLGLRCCVSAYGGVVTPGTDPFRVLRQPVVTTWSKSPYQFGFEMALAR